MHYYLKVYHSETKLEVHELAKQLYFIGRSENCHIKVNSISAIGENYISRCHLTLVLSKDEQRFYYTAYDGNVVSGKPSSSGVYIDKIRIFNGKKLKSGEIIDFVQTQNKVYPYLEYFEESEKIQGDMPTENYEFEK